MTLSMITAVAAAVDRLEATGKITPLKAELKRQALRKMALPFEKQRLSMRRRQITRQLVAHEITLEEAQALWATNANQREALN